MNQLFGNETSARLVSHYLPRVGKIYAAAMIRNDADIIIPFLKQASELFDKLIVADIQSTDGTLEILQNFSAPGLAIEIYAVDRQEKYQSALMNALSRKAFAEGADWVFFLDADEFIDVPSRAFLGQYLNDFVGDVMHLPWLNLVPSRYGTFVDFDISQEFYWSGRPSHFTKVAVSRLFAANNPEYYIHEGNHHVSRKRDSIQVEVQYGVPLLHLPVRSATRFKYKISTALRSIKSKHNRIQGEGFHVDELHDLLSTVGVESGEMNAIAANYSEKTEGKRSIDPKDLYWPSKRMHGYVIGDLYDSDRDVERSVDLVQTLARDARLTWATTSFIKGTPVGALIDNSTIKIVPQPVHGTGKHSRLPFEKLGPRPDDQRTLLDMLTDAAAISCMRPKRCTSSGWCRLVPVLFSLFSFVRPRRYVELGVHSGMSFFSACQASEHLELDADCIGIDSWLGDEHAGLQDTEVFSDVIEYLKQNYPDQSIIQTYFESALGCFESGSIDLLNIDGLHTYAAAKRDFESWLPKMSETGVIIFCETNVHEQNFGVWRLWGELSKRYPAFNFRHRHGLGILYVGSKPSPIAECLKLLQVDSGYAVLAQSYFESIGPLVSEDRTNLAELESLRAALKAERDGFDRARNEAHVAREEVKSLHERFDNLQVRYDQRLADLHARYYAVLNSTTWLMTAPARALLTPLPGVRRVIRRSMKLGWWTVTGQLLRRYRVWRDAGRDQAGV